MKCEDCPMRYVCDAILGGKDKCVYEQVEKVEPDTEDEDERS